MPDLDASDLPLAAAGMHRPSAAEVPLPLLLEPRRRAALNRHRQLTHAQKLQRLGLALLAVLLWCGLFAGAYVILGRLLSMPEVGSFLATKLLGMILLASFALLIFSNLITAVPTFFLSPELERLVAAPLSVRRLLAARFVETLLDSSWMVVLFALPLLLAYGVVQAAPAWFYAAVVLVLPPFLVIPAVLGVMVVALLVRIFPARRTRDILAVLTVTGAAILYVLLRLAQPERLLSPERFGSFVDFVRAVQTPADVLLPSHWALTVLDLQNAGASRIFPLLLLWSTAAALLVLGEAALCQLFPRGFSKAIEGRGTGGVGRAAIDVVICRLPVRRHLRMLIAREVKGFFRDTAQWSQLLLLGALAVVYVYNFSLLPTVASPLLTFYFKNAIAYANLALAAFVVAAVAARFVLPSVSMEGRAFWIVRTAPLPAESIWWSKFVTGLLPLLVLAEVLVVATNQYLGVVGIVRWISPFTIATLTPGIVALALAVGCAQPRFDAGDAARVAAGLPGLAFMILALTFIATVALGEAWPTYTLFMAYLEQRSLTAGETFGVTTALVGVLLINVAVPVLASRYGIHRLRSIEM